ncbi:PepSY-associated TM helix domain-containing protein [Fontisphaera persica]|uniref:PepSY-associated TM helix domain-containing protein n=1 Tax=Fontisphaera persica TaxID=2974023 RepID=UPI0024C04971|nr:PepSY-associated TM helix domain-containing protein [Fontisphaera persica]WCJ58696.1 PepSY-associated TM helix domain-containing protein [Fontisphaera persica]
MSVPNINPAAAPAPKNAWLLKFRVWHRWAGVAAALFLLIFSLTGMVLNYKKPIFQALGLETPPPATAARPGDKPASAPAPRHAGNLLEQRVAWPDALALARREWGEAPLERVELKMEQGEWLYKIKRKDGAELWVSAETGARFAKGEYEKVRRGADGAPVKAFDWGKFLLHLHTGKIGGPIGVAVMTLMGGALFFLTLSGLYLWAKPLFIRRANAAARRASPMASRAPNPAPREAAPAAMT